MERLGIIASDNELVAELRKQGFDALTGLAQERVELLVIALVMAHGRFQPDGWPRSRTGHVDTGGSGSPCHRQERSGQAAS